MINGSRVDLVVTSFDDPIVTGLLAERAAGPAVASGDVTETGREERPARRTVAEPGTVFLLARAGHEPVGCAGLRWLGTDTAEVVDLFVRAGRRGTGVARLLLAGVEDLAQERGCRVARLRTADPHDAGPGGPSGYARVPPTGPRSGAGACFEKALDPGVARREGGPCRASAGRTNGRTGVRAP